ncbi:hypothetical protein GYMLUDRAFT_63330 [Collybiopsis luxurians FD-317 M1]|uniref:Uncharacterized protein n=1 Tax=Collybiopsis luxurians FD-317 M1 TaxID=944289 RepID=A0A0D0BHB2_9AGAR|nr:hypothetical protein GYMLUDRAFT_63330 [Collybiopsis luxurians FD-317 M1]
MQLLPCYISLIDSTSVESGTLYPIAIIICFVLVTPAILEAVLLQIVGIVPILIMIRTSLGHEVDGASSIHITKSEEMTIEIANFVKPSPYSAFDSRDSIQSTSGLHRPTWDLPSGYIATPLQPLRLVHARGSSLYSDFRPMSSTNLGDSRLSSTSTTLPVYDFKLETGRTASRTEKIVELRYQPPRPKPSQSISFPENGSLHLSDNDSLQPPHYTTDE